MINSSAEVVGKVDKVLILIKLLRWKFNVRTGVHAFFLFIITIIIIMSFFGGGEGACRLPEVSNYSLVSDRMVKQ